MPGSEFTLVDSPFDVMNEVVVRAHAHSIRHFDEITRSTSCGCFYCLYIFAPSDIVRWIDERDNSGRTALCPECGIDSVIGDASGFPITEPCLREIHVRWFEN